MADRSSIFSSRKIPWAGLMALVAILALDGLAFRTGWVWPYLERRVPTKDVLQSGIVRDQLLYRDLRSHMGSEPRVVAIGTSRVRRGFALGLAQELLPHAKIGRIAHADVHPFGMRSHVQSLLDADVDVVVTYLSEFDTHRPVYIEPSPDDSYADLGALVDLVRLGGADFALDNRGSLLRVAASSVLDTYRFRTALGAGGLDGLRRFETGPGPKFAESLQEPALGGSRRPQPGQKRQVAKQFAPFKRAAIQMQVEWISQIDAGPHAQVQEGLVRSFVEELTSAGVEVVVMEAPLHPVAYELYDPSHRRAFLRFMQGLEEETDLLHFVPLERLPPFSSDDFGDLQHVAPRSAAKLTRAAVAAIEPLLSRHPTSPQ